MTLNRKIGPANSAGLKFGRKVVLLMSKSKTKINNLSVVLQKEAAEFTCPILIRGEITFHTT